MANAKEITILYRNHRREIALRRIVPLLLWFGRSEWHPGEERWFLKAFDCEKKAERDFEFAAIVGLPQPAARPELFPAVDAATE